MADGNLVTLAGLRSLLTCLQQDQFSELAFVHHYTNLDGGVRFEVNVQRRFPDVTLNLYNVSATRCSVRLGCAPVEVQLLLFNSNVYEAPRYAANYFQDTRGYAKNLVESICMHDPPLDDELFEILESINTSQHLQQCRCGDAYVGPRDMCACCMMSCSEAQLREETCVICFEGVPRMYSRRNDHCCGCHMHRRCFRALERRGMADRCPHCRHDKGRGSTASLSSLSSLDSYESVA